MVMVQRIHCQAKPIYLHIYRNLAVIDDALSTYGSFRCEFQKVSFIEITGE